MLNLDWPSLLQTYGYWILAVACLLEGETVLVLAAYAAQQGLLSAPAVVATAAVCGFLGDQGFFWIGRRWGHRLVDRVPALARQVERVDRLIERWNEAVIIGVRFAYGLRIAGPILIGTSTVAAARFAALNAIGALLWACLVVAFGWVFGAAAQRWLGDLEHAQAWVLGGLVAVGAIVAIVHRHRRH